MKRLLALLAIGCLVGIGVYCQKAQPGQMEHAHNEGPAYLNLHDSVAYVGRETCAGCHGDIHQTFQHTGMGRSLGPAERSRSVLDLHTDSLLYDSYLDLYYQPFWQGDSLWLREFRLSPQGDTLHQLRRRVDYIVGSGMHTNSHLYELNSHYFQLPFTFYRQEGRLDFPPGFEQGANSRFSRPIGLECMSCHNAMPDDFVLGSENKFSQIAHGIDCERCHGPGELHVKGIRAGNLVDTAAFIDFRIVNPARLPVELQFEVCQRCHLQGNAVLQPGKSFLDHKPGMKLSEVMNVYLPRYSNAEDDFIMASHVDRFKQSRCYQPQNDFNCISCHNPHVSVAATRLQSFNRTCQGCHSEADKHFCTASASERQAQDINCVGCHMPASTSIDIPHVTIHDHRIQVPRNDRDSALPQEFLGLFAINNSRPTPLNKARAYLQQYERFEAWPIYLDSARRFLELSAAPDSLHLPVQVQLLFLQGRYAALEALVEQRGNAVLLQHLRKPGLDNKAAWTAYRLGEALLAQGQVNRALSFYHRCVELAPLVPEFRNKYATALSQDGQTEAAQKQWLTALQELPEHRESLNNLGYSYLRTGRVDSGMALLQKAVQLYPDYEIAWLNLAGGYRLQHKTAATAHALRQALRINPGNTAVQNYYETLSATK